MCACRSEVETTEHFLLCCHLYSPQRLELFENLEKVDSCFLNLKVKEKVSFLLYGSQSATSRSSNHDIFTFVIKYIKALYQKIRKCNRIIGLIRWLSTTLPRNALLTIYKNFVRSHLDYVDVLYDKPNNENFQNKLEKVQYRACLAITGAIQGTSRTKFYDELGLDSLIKRRWSNKLIFFYKIVNGLLPYYLYSYLDFPSQTNYSLTSVSASV